MTLHGMGVSAGFAWGEAFVYEPAAVPDAVDLFEGSPEPHLEALRGAVEKAARELDELIERVAETSPKQADIFRAHKAILYDSEMLETIAEEISSDRKTPAAAVSSVYSQFIVLFSSVDDPLIAARMADMEDVRNRLLRALGGFGTQLSQLDRPVILVAHDLLPSDIVGPETKYIRGIVTETGSATSHAAILANALGIPAVLGAGDAASLVKTGQTVGIDAAEGLIFLDPDQETVCRLDNAAQTHTQQKNLEAQYLLRSCETLDGEKVEIGLNVSPGEAAGSYQAADYVGLLRTEFLYMERASFPSEDEQYHAYRAVLQRAEGKPVILRTLDIGGDKTLPYLQMEKEDNPFLGERALRLCLARPEIFKTQLRAVLRASVHGQLWVMIPMVGSIDDIRAARAVFEGVKADLTREGIPFDANIRFGIMIEIPAIAMIADLAAEEVDFASIGTNDLCQYLCAVDRTNPGLRGYYQSLSPAMIRTIRMIADAFLSRGKPLSVCGELGGDRLGALALLGLGIRKLSMSGAKIAPIKALLSSLTLDSIEAAVHSALELKTEEEVRQCLSSLAAEAKIKQIV